MDALLSPVSARYTNKDKNEPLLLREVKPKTAPPKASKQQLQQAVHSTEEALEILRNEPGYESLVSSLHFLLADQSTFDVHHPTPLSAQIVQALVTAILPNYWAHLLDDAASDLELFLACLRSITGLSALLGRLRVLIAETKAGSTAKEQSSNTAWELHATVEAVSKLLDDEQSVSELWMSSISKTASEATRRLLAQEYLNLLGGGRVGSYSAEAEMLLEEKTKLSGQDKKNIRCWAADGKKYSQWLVRGIIQWNTQDTKDRKLCGDLFGKAMRLGYPDTVIETLVSDILLNTARSNDTFDLVMGRLPSHEQKKILSGILKTIPEICYRSEPSGSIKDEAAVSSIAGLIQQVVSSTSEMREHLYSWLVASSAVGLEDGILIRRAAVAVAAENSKVLFDILDKLLAEFGDQLFIKHTPIILQEAKAQVLLLAAGYVHRANTRMLATLLRSRTYLSMVSNRLGASQTRARFLGMVTGEALSALVDASKKLNFDMDELRSEDAEWYKGLVKVQDTIGSIDSLCKTERKMSANAKPSRHAKTAPTKQPQLPKIQKVPKIPKTTGFIIEEVDDDEADSDDDLVPYGKPDSDAEDSDEDPTMLRRDKPKAPVYIRDLMAYFRDLENYDKQRLALTTAPVLIRRKATFGTEVQEHARDLATILVGLQDTFEMDDFHDLRLQSMLAIVVAQPRTIGPWMASCVFEGDYSLAQRASMLTALGLAARELAGFDVSVYAEAAVFPSKQLPKRMEQLYAQPAIGGPGSLPGSALPSLSNLRALPPGALDHVADSLTAGLLAPIAAKVADEATGPDVLKLASFKSRLPANGAVGWDTASLQRRAKQAKSTANTSAAVIAAAIFFPLTSRFQLALQATVAASPAASRSLRAVLFEPSLLSLFLKTLAVSLHSVGPSALALPDMTTELWSLLLGSTVQTQCVGDVAVTHAVLFALLALLDVNEGRMREICRDMGREVVQTRDWAMQVLDNGRGGNGSGDEQENEVKMLAAGIYIRLTEGVESYQNLLLGAMLR